MLEKLLNFGVKEINRQLIFLGYKHQFKLDN